MSFDSYESMVMYPKAKEQYFNHDQLDDLVRNELILNMMDDLKKHLKIQSIYIPESDMVKVFGIITVEVRP